MSRISNRASIKAGDVAQKFIAYLAENPEILSRFMTLTGVTPVDFRERLEDQGLHMALLDFLMQDESLLLAFAAEGGFDPAAIAHLHQSLQGEPS